MDQQLFNIVIGVAGALGGWWMKAMWEGLKDLQRTDHELTQQVNNLQVLVAGQYMRREVDAYCARHPGPDFIDGPHFELPRKEYPA